MEFEFWTFAVSAASVILIYLTAFATGAMARHWHYETLKLRIELARQPDLIREAVADRTAKLQERASEAENELVEIDKAVIEAQTELGIEDVDALQFIDYAKRSLAESTVKAMKDWISNESLEDQNKRLERDLEYLAQSIATLKPDSRILRATLKWAEFQDALSQELTTLVDRIEKMPAIEHVVEVSESFVALSSSLPAPIHDLPIVCEIIKQARKKRVAHG